METLFVFSVPDMLAPVAKTSPLLCPPIPNPPCVFETSQVTHGVFQRGEGSCRLIKGERPGLLAWPPVPVVVRTVLGFRFVDTVGDVADHHPFWQ